MTTTQRPLKSATLTGIPVQSLIQGTAPSVEGLDVLFRENTVEKSLQPTEDVIAKSSAITSPQVVPVSPSSGKAKKPRHRRLDKDVSHRTARTDVLSALKQKVKMRLMQRGLFYSGPSPVNQVLPISPQNMMNLPNQQRQNMIPMMPQFMPMPMQVSPQMFMNPMMTNNGMVFVSPNQSPMPVMMAMPGYQPQQYNNQMNYADQSHQHSPPMDNLPMSPMTEMIATLSQNQQSPPAMMLPPLSPTRLHLDMNRPAQFYNNPSSPSNILNFF